ncbi:hypothetical protein AKJ62_03080 [candidate division MSBL1 archaeon SCGC-AAA259D14]|uniref:Diaminopimelate epimerase n=2 Tax=candidate division MSBL1 TaxID=215777 RepID=A0A133U5K5_9EURY|nr:hypothetical protein AKJ62_03080 [candidate division MSBL1 archaeon SCGC-AAA259D14]
MRIIKMHGLGNSQTIVPDFDEQLEEKKELSYGKIAKALCNPNFGVGSDQIIILLPSEKADFRIRIFNKDGSEAEMCGNGIRCVARYLFDRDMVGRILSIETKAGIKELKISEGDDGMKIEVDMGRGEIVEDVKKVQGFEGTFVSVGNPHFVIFTEDASKEMALMAGPDLENADEFQPDKTNVEFATLRTKNEIETYVWERGAGLTLACGTGACATAFAAVKKGFVDSRVKINLLGGKIEVRISNNDEIKMVGPAEYIFRGDVHEISKIYHNVLQAGSDS